MARPVHFRSRQVCMTEVDWAAFSALLVEEFRDARYFASEGTSRAPEPPVLKQHLQLADVVEHHEAWMHFEQGWMPKWQERINGTPWWGCDYPEYPMVRLWRDPGSHEKRDEQGRVCLVYREYTPVDVYCRPGNKQDYAFARRLFRVLGKVTTNRNQKHVRYPSYETILQVEKGSEIWIGHDALRWAREDDRRLLCFLGDWGMRPMDD